MAKKGKRALITADNEGSIALGSWVEPSKPRTAVAKELQEQVDWMRGPPEVEVLKRRISWYRNHEADNPIDRPWSVGMLTQYPIQPQALPIVLEIQTKMEEDKRRLSIRQAKWVAQLYQTIPDVGLLAQAAMVIAIHAQVREIKGKHLEDDTAWEDVLLRTFMALLREKQYLKEVPDEV
tara:strand:+ start:253 stop:789 length:537 start_codon:yes stop_codon:yes gene_type:complete